MTSSWVNSLTASSLAPQTYTSLHRSLVLRCLHAALRPVYEGHAIVNVHPHMHKAQHLHLIRRGSVHLCRPSALCINNHRTSPTSPHLPIL